MNSAKKTETPPAPQPAQSRAAQVAEPGDENMRPVELRLPLNPANPKDLEVTVGLNGRFWKLQRGCRLQVPAAVAEILEHSETQTAAAIAYMQGAAARSAE